MQWLANISVRRPVFATVLMLTIVVLGVSSYGALGVDRFPDVDFPTVAVTTVLPGASPEEIETEISDKLEESLNTISGIDELRSISAEGLSIVYVGFVLEKDVDVAAQEVRDAVNRALPKLPQGIEQPVVAKMDPDASPILYLALDTTAPMKDASEIADKVVRRRLESIAGVGEVKLVGAQPRQLNVWLDPGRMSGHGITAAEVRGAIAMQNLTIPGGSLEAGPQQMTVRVAGRATSREQLADLVIREREGTPLRLSDVATVEDGVKDADSIALLDGKPAIVLTIRKQSGTNTLQVVDAVMERVAEVQATLPQGYGLTVVRDNSGTVRTSVNAVKEHLVLGAIFASIIVLLFLGSVRSTVIASIAIPISIVGTFALMYQQGFTLNTITMLALALAVGIVIDDAIVVLENIHRFIHEKKMKPFPAAILATREIGLAVLATTLSLLAVFLPIAFMSGIVGRFLMSFGLTMSFAIGASLLVAFTLTPMLSARWLRPHAAKARDEQPPLLERVVEKFYRPIESNYVHLLAWVMKHRWVMVVAMVVTFLSIFVIGPLVPAGFLPKSDEGQFVVEVRAPEGTRFEETALQAERIARQVRELPGVEFTMVTIGDSLQRLDNLANIYVRLNDPTEREQSVFDLMETVRRDVIPNQPKELLVSVMEPPMFEGGWKNKSIMYEITGTDLKELERLSKEAVPKFAKVEGAVDVDSDLFSGKPELVLRIDREKAADLGVRVSDVASALRILVGGEEVSEYREAGERYDVYLRADRSYRTDLTGLDLMTVPSSKLGSVRLRDVVVQKADTGPSVINRNGRKRQVMFTANAAPGASEAAIGQSFEKIMADSGLPPGYVFQAAGRSKEMGKMFKAFLVAVILSFVFMYLVLAAQFESWVHPITIMMALPLTLPFALISLLLLGQQLDIYSMLGILVLFGMVKKNSILQVDHTNQLRAKGLDRTTAILQANRDRLRPILMTTFAFVAGMLPLAFSKGIGAGFNQATAGVIVGGQVLSLILTLLATPVAYSLLDDLGDFLRRAFSRRSGPTPEELGIHEIDERRLEALQTGSAKAA